MKIDLTLPMTGALAERAQQNLKKAAYGHLGPHFDVMNKTFPLDYTERRGIVFNIRDIAGREVEPDDVDPAAVEPGMFVAFYSGFIEDEGYGTQKYFSAHPALSHALIHALLERRRLFGCAQRRRTQCGRSILRRPGRFHCGKPVQSAAARRARGHVCRARLSAEQSGAHRLPCRVVADI